MTYASHFKSTTQSEPIFCKPMIPNAAGGFVFEINDWQRLRRFLILGTEGGTYYEGERKLTLENAETLKRCITADGKRTVDLIVEVSDRGLAPKNDPAVFALACATVFGDPETRRYAFAHLGAVCRIGTHLFQFAEGREALGGGWGRGAREAFARWYGRTDIVAQALKYAQRNGWAHRDILRLAHPQATEAQKPIFDAICRPDKWKDVNHPWAQGYVEVQAAQDAKAAAALITKYALPRELVPTQFLKSPEVWAAMLPHMRLGALTRNLGNLSKCGLLKPLSETAKYVAARFADQDDIHRSRLHPFAILVAARTYASGHGVRGGGEWIVVPQVVSALDQAFELAFQNVEPTGKRFILAVDVSSSMSFPHVTVMSAAEAAAAMALVTARKEPNHYIMGFATQFKDLGIRATDSLTDVLRKTSENNFGGTDTTVAIRWALQNKIETDVFEVLTDSETWAGNQHTCEAIKDYRRKTGIPAKLAVVGFTATARSIADGTDHGSMDFVGMSADLPQALAAFVNE